MKSVYMVVISYDWEGDDLDDRVYTDKKMAERRLKSPSIVGRGDGIAIRKLKLIEKVSK